MSATLALARQLIERQSVTPEDAGCQLLLGERLQQLGFQVESLPFGKVSNLWASLGDSGPLFVFAGHTDVVPPGPIEQWRSDPFTATEHEGYLFGRGAADMKSSLAAMIVATEAFLANNTPQGRIGFLITSDEEGHAVDGTTKVIESLVERGITIDYCLIGEPSSVNQLGDTVKIGRRGSLSGNLTVTGKQGHVAYPDLANNPIHAIMPILDELCCHEWDQGNASFPATSFQISNIQAGTGANNVIPGIATVEFNLRFSTELSAAAIKQQIESTVGKLPKPFSWQIAWHLSGEPFLTDGKKLRQQVAASIKDNTGLSVEESTSGGTSDGRFIAPTGAEVVELGPVNASIHKVNECIAVDDLDRLATLYEDILRRMLA